MTSKEMKENIVSLIVVFAFSLTLSYFVYYKNWHTATFFATLFYFCGQFIMKNIILLILYGGLN